MSQNLNLSIKELTEFCKRRSLLEHLIKLTIGEKF
jgi:hypothetical protein